MRLSLIIAAALLLSGAAPAPVTYTNLAPDFDRFEARTADMPNDRRVAAFRAAFERRLPGLYADRDSARLDRRIARALAEFPSIRAAYRTIETRFGRAFPDVVRRFRIFFPGFVSPLPIYLVHDLGQRDGGSDYVGGAKVMLFGADMIAKIHNDDSLEPFIAHELFHLEHARHFEDCDQFWCPLWQEGLATFAAAKMTPHATDHQLLLDQPAPIRAETDAHWAAALCSVAAAFDSSDAKAIGAAFNAGDKPAALPARFGYYVGLRIAERAGRNRSLRALARLDDEAARPVVAAALAEMLRAAKAPCPAPPAKAPITHREARPA